MSTIERLSNSIAFKISKILELDTEKEEVLAYGAFSLIQTVWSIALVMIFGLVFNVFWEAVIISFSGALLRKYSGGAHASSPNTCAVIGVIVSVGPALILDNLSYTGAKYILIYACFALAFTYYIIYRYSPVDTPNKPIVKEETKIRLRRSAYKLTNTYLVIISLVYIYQVKQQNQAGLKIISSICTGILWQDITLLPLGHYIMSKLDIILKYIFSLIGGEKI